jgi:hypothetical protein
MAGGTHCNGEPNPAGVTTDTACLKLMAGWDTACIAAENQKIVDANARVTQSEDGTYNWTLLFPSPADSYGGTPPPSGSVTPSGSQKETDAACTLAAMFSGVDPVRLKLALSVLAARNLLLAPSPHVPASVAIISPQILTMDGAFRPSQSEFDAPCITHYLVLKLFDWGRYIPLTLFTSSAHLRLLLCSEDLKKV